VIRDFAPLAQLLFPNAPQTLSLSLPLFFFLQKLFPLLKVILRTPLWVVVHENANLLSQIPVFFPSFPLGNSIGARINRYYHFRARFMLPSFFDVRQILFPAAAISKW